MPTPPAYIGRFAPSPTGALHAGSLVAALASWLDARAHGGQWLVRIEDVDTPRCSVAAHQTILQQLTQHGLVPDAPPLIQSQRSALYQQALVRLVAKGLAYPCTCSRKQVAQALAASGHMPQRHAELVYPGTCRPRATTTTAETATTIAPAPPSARACANRTAWRLHVAACLQHQGQPASSITHWSDRRLGAQQQCVAHAVGDFVLRRADGLWAYQLAAVVDDGAQGITHIVRGQDLADNTARQIVLQQTLGLPQPVYLHTPLVLGANGEKLSKQNGAAPLPPGDAAQAVANLQAAAAILGLPALHAATPQQALQTWLPYWAGKYPP